jgi:Ca2+-binding RTX toxin-like protein
MLETAPAGTTILLAAGTYRLTETITIDRSNISLQGQGDATIFVMDPELQAPAFLVQKDIFAGMPEFALAETADIDTRDFVLTTEDHGLDVGSTIYLAQKNDQEWLASIESVEGKEIPKDGDQLREFHATVVAVDGAAITIDRDLPYSFQALADAPEANATVVRPTGFLSNVSLSGFAVVYEAQADFDDFTNTLPAWERVPAVMLNGTLGASLSDISVTNAPSHSFKFQRSLDLQAQNLSANGAHNKDGGNGYHFLLQELVGANLIGLSSTGARHSVLFSSYHAEHYNHLEIDFVDRDINFHGSPDSRNTISIWEMAMDYGDWTAEQWAVVHASQAQKHPEPYEVLNTNEVSFLGNATGANANDRIFGTDADNLFRGEGGDDTLRGEEGADTLLGGDGDDVLFGGAGADAMNGGAGFDTVEYSNAPEGVFVDLGRLSTMPVDGSHSSGDLLRGFEAVIGSEFADTLIGDNGANLIVGGRASDLLNGGKGNDTIFGGRGDDTIEAGDGSDLLVGERGNDHYTVRNASDRVIENANEGPSDHIRAFVSYRLPDEVEHLSLAGDAAQSADGNRLNNILTGNSANNILNGYAGNDMLLGASGNDTLKGSDGDDTLDGGAGADRMDGGQGSDSYFVNDLHDVVIENRKWSGHDVVASSVDFRMGRKHIEDLELTGDARLGAGNGLANTITGNDGNNLLDGGKNVDTLVGGLGNDRFLIRAPGDNAVELDGEGIDEVLAFRSYSLDAHVEKLFMQTVYTRDGDPAIFNGIGNDLDNTIIGTPFANTIIGRGGNDVLKGQAGNDTFVFDREIGLGNVDRLIDFETILGDDDTLKFKGSILGNAVAAGVLSADDFAEGTAATDATDRFIFDQTSGQLWFDEDGTGAIDQVLLATFEQNASVQADDILVF